MYEGSKRDLTCQEAEINAKSSNSNTAVIICGLMQNKFCFLIEFPGMEKAVMKIQWNLYNVDTLQNKKSVLIMGCHI